MTYTLGPSHAVSGAGVLAIAKPIGLKVAISGIPTWMASTYGPPAQYHLLGRVALGNVDGFLGDRVITQAASLFYPIPDGLDQLAYDLVAGLTMTVTELREVAVAVPGALAMPWDRNALPMTAQGVVNLPNGGAVVSAVSYTVPAGRKLWLTRGRVRLARYLTAAAPGQCSASVTVAGMGQLLYVANYTGGMGDTRDDQFDGAPLLLLAGQSISGSGSNPGATDGMQLSVVLSGFLFDA